MASRLEQTSSLDEKMVESHLSLGLLLVQEVVNLSECEHWSRDGLQHDLRFHVAATLLVWSQE